MTWIPRTKFQRPESGPDILFRPELLGHLRQEVTARRLTLVSAQAGAGKTTLVASLAERYPELSVGWIALDEGDDSVEAFLSLLTAAISRMLAGHTFNSAAVMSSQPEVATEPQRIIGLLINDILDIKPDSFVLVLDDLHTIINKECLAALDYLLARLPSMMHLIVTSRSDPPLSLSRLRARGQLAEIRMAQLRFSADETAAWLRAELGAELSKEDLAAVEQHTEGWVTALRLLALSLQARSEADRKQLIRNLSSSHHFIFDYLLDEVVHRLPAETRGFVMETSILEVMTPALCRAVTERTDAHELLEELYRQSLFISRTEEPGAGDEATYQYHALFRRALQQELRLRQPGRLAELHRRAADALETSPAAAEHYLVAEAWQEAANLLEEMVRQQVELGAMPAQLVALVDELPAEVLAGRPWLRAAQGIQLLQGGQKQAGRPLLEEAAQGLADAGDRLSRAYLLFNLTNVSAGAEMAAYLDEIGAVFKARGDEVPPRWQVDYHQAMVWRHIHVSDWPAVEQHLETAVDIAIRSGEPGAFYTLATNNFTHFFYSERATASVLRLRDALQAHLPPDDLLARLGVTNISLCQHWYQGEVGQAEKLAMQAQGLSRKYGVIAWADANSMLILMYIQWARDNLNALGQALEASLARMVKEEAWNFARNDILCMKAMVQWREGRGVEARALLPEMGAYTFFERQRLNTALASGLVAAAEGNLVAADGHLREAISIQRTAGFTTTAGARLVLSVVYWQAGEREAALREFGVALDEWQRRNLPGVVLQTGRAVVPLLEEAVAQGIKPNFAGSCLDAFGLDVRPRAVSIPATGETLTAREAEVLGLIVRGKTNPEIAADLVISENTVKSHITRVLAKLGVSRRTEAAIVARELGLS